ncbi:MAG: tetratricopeptide repeat protein [Aureispira sp.]|nr:tetratricopeptide repeat protein [Aureispira sp.]
MFAAKTLADSIQHSKGICDAFNNAALIYYAEGLYEKGIESSIRAIQLAKQINNSSCLATAYTHLGLAYSAKGYMSKAMEYNIKALEIAEQIQDSTQTATCFRYIGSSYFNLKDYKNALFYFNKATNVFEDVNDQLALASVYIDVGKIYLQDELLEEAQLAMEKGLTLSKKLGNKRGVAYGYSALSEVFILQDELDKAEDYLKDAASIYLKLGDKSGQALALKGLARVNIKQEHFKLAVMNLERAVIMAKIARAKVLAKELYLDLSDAYAAQKDYRNALIAYSKYSVVKDSIFSRDKSRQLAEIQTKYETERLAREKLELSEKNQQQSYAMELQNKEQELVNNRNFLIIIVLIFAILLGIIVAVLMLRQNRLKAQVRESELEQRALHAQMNPHFMFNSLNSIQSLIATGDNSAASIYLARFSRLMRTILQHSRETFVPIQKEIEFISNYVELEKRRFNEAFDIEIDDEDVEDTHFTMIPTFVIQPFIENAIIHGLLRKPEKGHLKIMFEHYNKNFLKCIVEDDGIGREKASEFKSDKKHQSLGVGITEQRLQYLSMNYGIKEDFVKFIDLKNDTGEACGTRVELLLPIKYKTA